MKRKDINMIVLKVIKNHGLYVLNEEEKSILNINKEDILKLLDVLYLSQDIIMDPLDDSHIILNEAEKVIYENIYKYFEEFISKKADLKNEIENEFSEFIKQIEDESK